MGAGLAVGAIAVVLVVWGLQRVRHVMQRVCWVLLQVHYITVVHGGWRFCATTFSLFALVNTAAGAGNLNCYQIVEEAAAAADAFVLSLFPACAC